MLKITMVL